MKVYISSCDSCGWTSDRKKTPGRAESCARQHSCEEYQRTAERRARAAERAAQPLTPERIYQKRWRLDRARGIRRLVDAGEVSAHIRSLVDRGASVRSIADTAGLAPSVISRLGRSKSRMVRSAIARRILSVTLDTIRERPLATGFVPKEPARRRLRALLALGWRHTDISPYLTGIGTRSHMVLHQRGTWIARRTHDAVAAAYEALCMKPGPSDRTRIRAAQLGYLPPLAWDDIDDLAENPELAEVHSDSNFDGDIDEIAVERAAAGDRSVTLTAAETNAAIERLRAEKLSTRTIAERLGVKPRALEKALERARQREAAA